jgi:hypothetical protein
VWRREYTCIKQAPEAGIPIRQHTSPATLAINDMQDFLGIYFAMKAGNSK